MSSHTGINTLESKVIDFLRFPLIVGVVLIHARIFDVPVNGESVKIENFAIASAFMHWISGNICSICVPMFFFISGYLFFKGCDDCFPAKLYIEKIKTRIRTLVIPYLFWNLLVLGVFWIVQTILPDMVSGNNKAISDYEWRDFLWAFWNKDEINGFKENGTPIALQFWYIRDLFMVCLFTPLIYFLLKKFKLWAIVVFELLSHSHLLPDVVGFGISSFFFFSLGAYFKIHGTSFIFKSKILYTFSLIMYVFTLVYMNSSSNGAYMGYVYFINILLGMIVLVQSVSYLLDKGRIGMPKVLSDSSFFIFAYHGLFGLVLTRLSLKVFHPADDFSLICIYLICPTITVLVGIALHRLLKKYLPRFTAVITGGR